MKKSGIILLLAVLLCLQLGVPVLAAEEEAIEIRTVGDLARMAANPGGSYRLAADLDLSGIYWTPVDFSGVFDGNGHTIYNLTVDQTGGEIRRTVDGNDKTYDTAFAGLFAALTDAEVKDLKLVGVDVNVKTAEHCFAAALAGYLENATVTGVTVSDARVALTTTCQENPAGPTNRCMAGVGGLLGFGQGTVTGCAVDAVLVFDDQSASALKCEQFLGGILACGNAVISDCQVKIGGYDACRGYAHNGGLVGMFYRYDKAVATGRIENCRVEGSIRFFEDNRDRRAYCKAYVGELLTSAPVTGCTEDFTRDEIYDYTETLRPEGCAEPQMTDIVTAFACDWGYTTHTCTVCGNTWRDSFTPPPHVPGEWTIVLAATFEESGLREKVCTQCGEMLAREVIAPHVAGEWTVVQAPDYGRIGLRQRVCTDCGVILEEETIPAIVAVEACVLDPVQLELECGGQACITVQVEPAYAENTEVLWSSTDDAVAVVDESGVVYGVGPGTATILCTSADGFAQGACTVVVHRSPWQWVVHYLLFGWLWETDR